MAETQQTRMRWLAIGGAAVATISALLIVVTFKLQSDGPLWSNVAKANRHAIPRGNPGPRLDASMVAAHGVVEPAQPEARLTADMSGRIAAIFAAEGDHVTKGTILAEVENLTLKSQVSAAEAALSETQAELERAMQGMVASDVSAIVSESTAAHAKAKLAESDLSRSVELAKTGSIANAELENFRQRYAEAQAEYAAASARAASARGGSRREDILVAQARVRAAEARVDESRAALTRSIVLAPFDGDVLRVKARIGEYHNPGNGEPILILGDLRNLRIRLDVDERDIARIKVGVPAYATAAAFGDDHFVGKVVEVAKRMGRRTVRVDDPVDRIDVKVLEVVISLDGNPPFVPGQRVEGFLGPLGK